MTIKDMEQLTGITRQNIRFYEREGLITPSRNPENQYREYSLEDAKTLKRIKLYRKLNVSIEDIRNLENRTISLQSCMEQCISNTEKEMARMSKMKEVCEELKRQDSKGLDPDVEETLERIEAYEKSGYQFADISKDYWSNEVVAEIRGLNRQLLVSLFIGLFVMQVVASTLYYSLSQPQWILTIPVTIIGFIASWIWWSRKHVSVVKKHVRFSAVPPLVWLAAACMGLLFYPVTLGGMMFVDYFKPSAAILENTKNLIEGTNVIRTWLFLLVRNILYSLIACVLFYDTYKQKSLIPALGLSALVFALICCNPYTAIGYFIIGICLAVLYEMTDSAAVCIVSVVFEIILTGVFAVLGNYYPDSILGAGQSPSFIRLLPWLLLSIILILVLLYGISLITGRKIDWKQEWEKVRGVSVPKAENAVIMDQSAFREIEIQRKRSYRILDGYVAAGLLLALLYTTQIFQ